MKTIWIINHYAIPPSLGGLNRHYYFKRELEKKGYKVRIITSAKIHNSHVNFSEKGYDYVERNIDGVEYTFVNSGEYQGNGIGRYFSFIQFPVNTIKVMRKLFFRDRPDVIYTSSPDLFTAFVASKYAKKKELPLIVEIRDAWPDSIITYTKYTKKNPVIKILYKLEKLLYQNADALIFTWQGGKEYIKDKKWDIESGGSIDLNKVFYVNNGVDLSAFDNNLSKFPFEDKYNTLNKFNVTYAGSIRRVNRVDIIIDAASILKKETNVFFNIYGEGNYKDELIKKCEDNNLKNVMFYGYVSNEKMASILKASKLNIIAGENHDLYKYGTSMNKLFVYMAAGRPVLSNVKSGYNEITISNCGIVLDSNSPEELANGIKKIMNLSKKEYENMCNNARETAKKYDYSVLADKLEKIILYISK